MFVTENPDRKKHLLDEGVEAPVHKCSSKELFLKIRKIYRELPVLSLFLIKLQTFRQKETPTQVFSCEYCEIFKKTKIFFIEHLRTTETRTNFIDLFHLSNQRIT